MNYCTVCSVKCEKSCSRCKTTYYCSKKCQKKDWKKHRSECNEIKIKKKIEELKNNENKYYKHYKNHRYRLNPRINEDKFFKWREEPEEVEKRKNRRDQFYNWISENYKSKYNIFRKYFDTEFDIGMWINRVNNEKIILFTEYDHNKEWSRWFTNCRSMQGDEGFIHTPYLFDGGAFILIGDSYITQTYNDDLNNDIVRFQKTLKTINKIYICQICQEEKDSFKTCDKCTQSICNDCDQEICNRSTNFKFRCPYCRDEKKIIIVKKYL